MDRAKAQPDIETWIEKSNLNLNMVAETQGWTEHKLNLKETWIETLTRQLNLKAKPESNTKPEF